MSSFVIKGTLETPTIEFNSSKGDLLIKGRSIPENAVDFYAPFFDVFETYVNSPLSETNVNVQLEYFNTSSSKCILEIFKLLQKINLNGFNVNINWYYDEDDDEILETGQDYSNMINLPFNIQMLEE